MIDTVKKLCSMSGVSGCEDEVRGYIRGRIEHHASDMRVDSMGNLIVFKRGKGTPSRCLMLCAHMDEVGIIITSINSDGYLKFDFVGGIDRRTVIGKRVYIGSDRLPGVIGIKAYHHVTKDEEKQVPKLTDLYIDIGADGEEAAKSLVSLGDFGVFAPNIIELGGGNIKAKALDDRIGCAALVKLIEETLEYDCHFVFTVQEEVGTRGALAAAFGITPDIAVIAEGTTAADLPFVPKGRKICSPGCGVVIPFMDGGTIYDRTMFEFLRDLAEKNGIPWQTKNYISGGTDAAAVQRTKSGIRVAGVAAAIRYIHSPASVGNKADFEGMLSLLRLFINNVEELNDGRYHKYTDCACERARRIGL